MLNLRVSTALKLRDERFTRCRELPFLDNGRGDSVDVSVIVYLKGAHEFAARDECVAVG